MNPMTRKVYTYSRAMQIALERTKEVYGDKRLINPASVSKVKEFIRLAEDR